MARKTCFISAEVQADTSVLKEELEARSVQWIDSTSFALGPSISESVELAISRADFFCVVTSSISKNSFALYEIGLARGLGKPVLIFAEASSPIPVGLRGVIYSRCSPIDRDAISFHLDAFLQHGAKIQKTPKFLPPLEPSISNVAWAKRLLAQTDGSNQSAFQLEELVAGLFEQAGAEVSRQQSEGGARADLVLWMDSLQSAFSNPVVVEIKTQLTGENSLRRAEMQVRSYIERFHAGAGILIFGNVPLGIEISVSNFLPPVFVLSVQELIDLVGNGQLSAELVRRRNRIAHGFA